MVIAISMALEIIDRLIFIASMLSTVSASYHCPTSRITTTIFSVP